MSRPVRRVLALGAFAALTTVSCGGSDEPDVVAPVESSSTTTTTSAPTSTTTTSTSTPTTTSTTTTITTIPDGPGPTQDVLDAVALDLELIAGADVPIDMAVDPASGRVLLGQRSGTVVVFDGGQVGETVLDISENVSVEGEGGFLSLTFDPTGEHLYVSFTDVEGDSRVVAYDVIDGVPDQTLAHVVFEQDQPEILHNGGHIRFGPDGLLYLSLGDGSLGNDPDDRGQRLDTLLGKIIRIEPTPAGPEPYVVPADNPFVGVEGVEPEIWAYGLRNPWRFAFDPVNGDLWISDVGQYVVEEINWVSGARGGAAANFGWERLEGPISRGPAPDDHVEPVLFYNHDGGRCAVIGGVVYRGTAIPDLVGAYIFSDFCDGAIRAISLEDGAVVAERDLELQLPLIISMAEGPDREIYAFSLAGDVRRIAPA